MRFDPQYILLALAPVFLGFVVWEWYVLRQREDKPSARYTLRDSFSNATLALMHQGGDLIAAVVVLAIYGAFFDWRLFDLPLTWWSLALAFLLQDFLYYWFHRASHRIRWCWASHVVHHSSERLNFTTAFRQSLTYPISGMWVFWIPMVALGFTPETVITVVLINLAYQFFVHTQLVNKLGPLEWVFNTPSHHRVHHACNADYIDRNYGGVLIIWDRLFGTFVEEREEEPCVYGITRPVDSHNPLTLTFHEWRAMGLDALAPGKTLEQRLMHLWRPPEWQPENVGEVERNAALVPGEKRR